MRRFRAYRGFDMPSMSPRIRRPTAPMIVALLALFIALGGPAQAARLLDGSKIKKGTVGSKQLDDRSIRTRDLSRATVRALGTTPDGSISAAKLAPNAVTTAALAPGGVLTGNVADGTLTSADLGTNSVGSDEIADSAVGQAQIRANGVAASEIADASIDGREIVDGGLSVRDVARVVAPFRWPVKDLGRDECQTKWVTVPAIEIAGDFVLISPTSAWPQDLIYTVNGTNSETEFKVNACNRGTDPVAGATYVFNYAVVGF